MTHDVSPPTESPVAPRPRHRRRGRPTSGPERVVQSHRFDCRARAQGCSHESVDMPNPPADMGTDDRKIDPTLRKKSLEHQNVSSTHLQAFQRVLRTPRSLSTSSSKPNEALPRASAGAPGLPAGGPCEGQADRGFPPACSRTTWTIVDRERPATAYVNKGLVRM